MSFFSNVTLGLMIARFGSLTKAVAQQYATAAPPRPRRWSMKHNYTSWVGLHDRSYTGRHMDEDPAGRRTQPDMAALLDLFLRPQGGMVEDERTSVLFLFFAQWFTDSFLRTNLWDHERTDSNHEIDLCALYGLTEEKTEMLRHQSERHLMDYVMGADGEFPPRLYETQADALIPEFPDANGAPRHYRYRNRYVSPAVTEGWQTVTRYLHDPKRMVEVTRNASPARLTKYFAMGLEHGNGTLGYVVINILFLRLHNKIARHLREIYCPQGGTAKPDWDLDRVFHTTRSIVMVILLKIVVEEYITHIAAQKFTTPIGFADDKRWGKTNRIAIEFNLLYRWHSLVPDAINAGGGPLSPANFLHNPGLVEKNGLASLLTDFSNQRAGRMSLLNHPDFFAQPPGSSTLERTLEIGRDSKLRTMNQYREHFGLKPYFSFEDLVGEQPNDAAIIAALKQHYPTIHDVEWFVGIFAEKHSGKRIMGDLMLTMVANDAFTQALTNPLLSEGIFSPKGAHNATFTAEGKRLIEDLNSLQKIADYVLGEGKAVCSFTTKG
ncbi:MAG: peroxidase family protein [Pseudomonadota bacterium]